MAVDSKHLPEDPKVLQKMVLDLMAQLDRESNERHKVEAMLRELLDARRNRKSEQLSADQLALFATVWEARQAAEASKSTEGPNDPDNDTKPDAGPAAPKKNNGGRQPLAKHLKRERIVHDLTDSEKHCEACAQDLRPIGEESSERYEYIPAQMMVIEDVCKKYACACTVKTATKPPQPIEKSTAGASVLAQVIVAQTVDHLPLHRQEKIFERHGVEISRKTMGGWMGQMRRFAKAVVRIPQGSAVPVQGHRDRRYRREGVGQKTAIRPYRTDLAILRRRSSSGDRLRLHQNPGANRTGEVPGGLSRLLTGRRLCRVRCLLQKSSARVDRSWMLGSCPKVLSQSVGF